jgi:lycopene beta-cyclase
MTRCDATTLLTRSEIARTDADPASAIIVGVRGEGHRTMENSKRRGGTVALPWKLEPQASEPGRYAHVILGAGCAGLSLCYYLLEHGVEGPILIMDRKETFTDDRTWCFWDVEETPFSGRAVRSWSSWVVRADGREILHTTDRYPYLCLTGEDFYEAALEKISAAGNVTVRLGEEVLACEESDGDVRVTTTGGSYRAGRVFDGRGLPAGSPAFEAMRRDGRWISQQFLGLRLRARSPVFDPSVCTLMDFSVDQDRGLRFAYVLPFDEHEALVENVYLSRDGAPPDVHREEISAYLSDRYGLSDGDYEIDGEERGDIPMVTSRLSNGAEGRVVGIGTLGGDTRPSTGYAFLRVQRHCRALAASVTGDGDGWGRVHPWRYGVLDRVFLRLLRERPGMCPAIYARMFAGVPPAPLVRFLTETSSPIDDAGLIGALPKAVFLRLAAGEAIDRVRKAL